MNRQAFVSDAAERDLVDIYDYLAERGERAAHRMISRFYQRFDDVARSPELGRRVDDLQPGLRRVNEGIYAVFYREIDGGIEVARVYHGMRNVDRLFP